MSDETPLNTNENTKSPTKTSESSTSNSHSAPMGDKNPSVEQSISPTKSKNKKEKEKPRRDSKARTASAATFFNDNKAIAGFGNSLRSVFTSVRELIENSLDAAEKRGVTPDIKLRIRKLKKAELIKLMGTSVIKTKESRIDFIELSCKDNGVGVPRDLIPQLFGTVLAGTKYGMQQSRGRFGLGSKMVLLHAMSTLDLPIQITTRPMGEDITHRVKLFINLEKNEPIVVDGDEFYPGHEEYFDDYGTEIKVSFTGSWTKARNFVREYLRQLAIITPYADITVDLPNDKDVMETLKFIRIVDEMPNPPQVDKIHPWGTDISTIRREINSTNEHTIVDFLHTSFKGIPISAAISFCKIVGIDENKDPRDLTSPEIRRIVHDGFNQALKESRTVKRKRDRVFQFDDPTGEKLSPLGPDRLRKGLEKELAPKFVETISRPARAYEGHPFIIEAAIGYGGGVNTAATSKSATILDNKVVYRYANRIPLIFGAGNDLITEAVNSINWSEYGLTRASEPLAITVSLVSTKIPFPETSKDYIDKVDEISAEVKLTLMQLGRKLKTYLGRQRRRSRESQRKSRFVNYAPKTVIPLLSILKKEGLWDPITGVSPERITAALASGKPRIGTSIIPFGTKVTQAPIWINQEFVTSLQLNGIFETASFLRRPNDELTKFLQLSEKEIDNIKRRTIRELDDASQIIELDSNIIITPELEKRFHRKSDEKILELPRISKALYRRWIRNTYDYLVSPHSKLMLVHGLGIKLFEGEKAKIINSMKKKPSDDDEFILELSSIFEDLATEGLQEEPEVTFEEPEVIVDQPVLEVMGADILAIMEGKILLKNLLPSFELILEHSDIKKRKISSLTEFLYETAHPSIPLNEKGLAPLLIPHFKKELLNLVELNPEIINIKIDDSSPDWIDGYLRYAFRRRNYKTIGELLKVEDKILMEIGELQRTLYNALRTQIIPSMGKIRGVDFPVESAIPKIEMLEAIGINNIEQFVATPARELAENPDLQDYLYLLLDETKSQIMEYLTLTNNLGDLYQIKDISKDIENELDELEVNSTTDLLSTPITEFKKKSQEIIKSAKLIIGTKFEGFSTELRDALSQINVLVLEDLVYSPNYYLDKHRGSEYYDDLELTVELLHKPINYLSPNLVENVKLLKEAGVTTIGQFLVRSDSELANITGVQIGWISLVKESFEAIDIIKNENSQRIELSKVTFLVDEDTISTAEGVGLTTIQEIYQIKYGTIIPKIDRLEPFIELHNLLISPISVITEHIKKKAKPKEEKTRLRVLNEAVEDLAKSNIKSIFQFFNSSTNQLIGPIGGKGKKAKIDALLELSANLQSNSFTLLKTNSKIKEAYLLHSFVRKLDAPTIFLNNLSKRDIELLTQAGITDLYQFSIASIRKLAEITGRTQKAMKQLIDETELKIGGTLIKKESDKKKAVSIVNFKIDDIEYFSSEDIIALETAGYTTIESLYYSSDHRTFEVPSINYDVISHFRKLLQSPLVIIFWKKEPVILPSKDEGQEDKKSESKEPEAKKSDSEESEDKKDKEEDKPPKPTYETFLSTEFGSLGKIGITRVIDFLTTDIEVLKQTLGWDQEKALMRLNNVELQEAGISLSDLEIFRSDHIVHLNDIGYSTIQDLYFSATEENWDSTIIPWQSIQTIKNILHLELINAKEELGPDMLELLISVDVKKILDLYLTGDAILEQKTGQPAERFENLRFALDLGALIAAFDKSVFFTPGFNFFQVQILRKKGLNRILDIVLEDNAIIAKHLGIKKKEVDIIVKEITRNNILRVEEERGVPLRYIQVFNRTEVRSISRSGIFEFNELDTLQEIIYQLNTEYFYGEDYLLDRLINLRKVCNFSLDKIGDLNAKEVALLKKNKIITISDVLMIGLEDIVDDYDLNLALTNTTKSVMDLRAFVALSELPSDAAISSTVKVASDLLEDESIIEADTILDTWITNGAVLHKRTMNNIRSLLSMPVSLTKVAKDLLLPLEEFENSTIADVILGYYPDEISTGAIISNKFKQKGALIKLLKENSNPVTLINLQPLELRALLNESITTVERVLMNDPKYLSTITGKTQKIWREIKEIFDPEMFEARLQDIGIPFTSLNLPPHYIDAIKELDIQYLEEVLLFDNPGPEIEDLKNFLMSSTYFLIGSPGEKELSENASAQTIVESIVALRGLYITTDIVKEILAVGWNAYAANKIPIPKKLVKEAKKRRLNSLQDMVHYTIIKGKENVPKSWLPIVEPLSYSPLYFNLSSTQLKEIIEENRCSTIMEAITSPMLFGEVDNLRILLREGSKLEFIDQIIIPNKFLLKSSKALWNRFEKSDLSVQDILSSPRTMEVYRNIRQRYLREGRQFLKIPLSLVYLNNRGLFVNTEYEEKLLTIEDLIFALPSLYEEKPEFVTNLISSLDSDALKIKSDISLEEELIRSVETALNTKIPGLHSFYTETWKASKRINSLSTHPVILIKQVIYRSLKSVSTIPGIMDEEIWNLWRLNIKTVINLLIRENEISETDLFTKKRVGELISSGAETLYNDIDDPMISIKDTISGIDIKEIYKHDYSISILNSKLVHPTRHGELIAIPKQLKRIMRTPLILTNISTYHSLKDIKEMYSNGILTVADYLVYPSSIKLGKLLGDQKKRLEIIKDNSNITRKDIDLSSLKLPGVDPKATIMLSRLIHLMYSKNVVSLLNLLSYRLSYTSIDKKFVQKLNKSGIITLLDFLLTHPNIIKELLNQDEAWLIDQLSKFNLSKIKDQLSSSPLLVENDKKIAATTKDMLKTNLVSTFLDLSRPLPGGINRSDENYLNTIITILNSDYSTLLVMPELHSKLVSKIDKLEMKSSLDLLRNHLLLKNKDFSEKAKLLDGEGLIKYADDNRRFSDLDGIVVREEQILKENGIFTFNQLASLSEQRAESIDIDSSKLFNIVELVNSDYSSIVGLSTEIEDEIGKLGLSTVSELLSHKLLFGKIAIPVKVIPEIQLVDLFNKEILKSFGKVTTISKLFKSTKIKKSFKNEDVNAIKVICSLNMSIQHLPELPSTWINKLRINGIHRTWQYLTADLDVLTKICSSSFSAQQSYRNNLKLDNIIDTAEFNLPIKSDDDKELLSRFGLKIISDILSPGDLSDFYKSVEGVSRTLDLYKSTLQTNIWMIKAFWNLSEDDQISIAIKHDKIIDLYESGNKFKDILFNACLNNNLIHPHPFDGWLSSDIINNLDKIGITSVESWFYQDMNSTGELPGRSILRASVSQIPNLQIKHITSANRNGISHISDLILQDEKNLAKIFKTTKTKLVAIRKDVLENKLSQTKLRNIGILNEKSTDALKTAGIINWGQFFGNIKLVELNKAIGITPTTKTGLLERINVPIWHLLSLRESGIDTLTKYSKNSIRTVLELLVIGDRALEIMDEDSLRSLYDQISTSELNKGGKHPLTLLSSSYKIKVKELGDLKTVGITDPIDIILGNYDESKVKQFSEGITNWKNLVELSVDELIFPENVIKSFKKNKFNLVKHLIIAPNSQLKDLGATYSQINAFRSKLNRKKGTDLKAPKTKGKPVTSTKASASKSKGKKSQLGIKKFQPNSTAKSKKPKKKSTGSKSRGSKGTRSKKSKK